MVSRENLIVRPRTHRIALSLLVGVLVISAGCSAIQDDSESSTNLLLVNQDNSDHAVVVEILENSREVYSTGTTIEAESDVELESFNHTGEYDVKVSVDGESTVIPYTFTEADSPETTSIGIDNNGNVTVGT